MSLIEEAVKYAEANLSIIPTRADKSPAITEWKLLRGEPITTEEAKIIFSNNGGNFIWRNDINKKEDHNAKRHGLDDEMMACFTKLDTYNIYGIAILCGTDSECLEVIDVDCKYDLTGKLWDHYSELLKHKLGIDTYSKLVIVTTKNKGYHIYYKCLNKIENNQSLAQRETTPEERVEHPTQKIKVLIETRGEGGYIVAPPTPDYKCIQGDITNIPYLTPEDRDIIINTAKSFDLIKTSAPIKSNSYNKTERIVGTGLKSYEDYNQRGDIISLLEKHGFKQVGTEQGGDRVLFLRDGSDANKSGDFSYSNNTFKVFSTSTQFEATKGYTRSSVFSILECNGDFSISAKRLSEMGYGDKTYKGDATFTTTQTISVNKVNTINAVNSVIADAGDLIKIENIDVASGDKVLITITEESPEEEINKAIEVIRQRTDKIFIQSEETEFIYYDYFLNKYIADFNNSDLPEDRKLSDLTSSVIDLILSLPPIARDRVKFQFLIAVKHFGITEHGFNEEIKIKLKQADEKKVANKFNDLLLQSESFLKNGELSKAINNLKNKLPLVDAVEVEEEQGELKRIVTEDEVTQLFKKSGGYLKTGLSLGGEEFRLPSGALTGIVGSTGHGKTDVLINLMLRCVIEYPEKEFYFFSYELSLQDCIVRFLNTYMDLKLNQRSNTELMKEYYRTGETQYFTSGKLEEFKAYKEEFYKELIYTGRLRVKGIRYSAEKLCNHIEELSKEKATGGFFIDYFQKITSEQKGKKQNRQEELKHISDLLEEQVKHISLPMVLGVQFNRQVANPLLIDERNIGEAGDIERILDTIIALWYCNKTTITIQSDTKLLERLQKEGFTDEGKLYAICLKSRDIGSGSKAFWNYDAQNGKIRN